jgi:hypothetical protein
VSLPPQLDEELADGLARVCALLEPMSVDQAVVASNQRRIRAIADAVRRRLPIEAIRA